MMTFTFSCNQCGYSMTITEDPDTEYHQVQQAAEKFDIDHINHKRGI